MLFSSVYFLFLFLPATVLLFGLAGRFAGVGFAVGVLTLASVAFYAVWRPWDVPILLASVIANWALSLHCDRKDPWAKVALATGVVADLAVLFWFKYAVFASTVAVDAGLARHPMAARALPLGISFFTFVQIAYLVDRYRGRAARADLGRYLLFVCFFPHLIAGPIVHHSKVMPQLDRPVLSWRTTSLALFIFAVGLAKKTLLADPLSLVARSGFGEAGSLATINAWVTVVAYAFQLYFDFSGYSDMAVGLALLFGVEFPWNFLSPYRSTTVSEFWRTWHVTLGNFLRDYVYIPLGGSRVGRLRTSANLLVTMVVGGIWHGAGWTYVMWGGLHGAALVANHRWTDERDRRRWRPMPTLVAWALTTLLVLAGWVLFRAATVGEATAVYRAMVGLGGHGLAQADRGLLRAAPYLLLATLIALVAPNTKDLSGRFKPTAAWALCTGGLLALSMLYVLGTVSAPEFLYGAF
jgi:D-alanyl-lipoteichoic acid acyltransferase DltB (MBOAT superfamily)